MPDPAKTNKNNTTVPGDRVKPESVDSGFLYGYPNEAWGSDWEPNSFSSLGPEDAARRRSQINPNGGKAPLLTPTLESDRLILEPLTLDTFEELRDRTRREPALFQFLDMPLSGKAAFDLWFINALKATAEGERLHFVLRGKRDDTLIGHTAILNIRPAVRVDIGWTWVLSAHQRQGFARESKGALYELLFRKHSFRRVQITADSANERSIRSIIASGATQETVMLNARVRRDGGIGHTAVFRILDTEYLGTPSVSDAA